MTKTTVDIGELFEAFGTINSFNELELSEHTFVLDGKEIPITDKILDEWRFVGLSNAAFFEMRYWEMVDGH